VLRLRRVDGRTTGMRAEPTLQRSARPRRRVADPHEHPDEEEDCVQGAERLGQRADRQVVLVRAGVDAEYVPRRRECDHDQPRRHPAQREPAAAAA
jgi:hypothetical protein